MGLVAGGETRVIDGLLLSVYISLHTGDPVLGGNEIVGGSYARQAYAYSKAGSDPTVASNSGVIQFPAATTTWGTITHIGIYSALTAGTLLATQALDTSKPIDIDDVARFPIGNLKVLAD
jgi:hypothetical protein